MSFSNPRFFTKLQVILGYDRLCHIKKLKGLGSIVCRHCSSSVYNVNQQLTTNKLLTEHLLKNVIYDNKSLIALNKPAGISMIGKTLPNGDRTPNIMECLGTLKNVLECDNLLLVQGLLKDLSGVVVFATSELAKKEMVRCLRTFKQDHVCHQHFLVICRGQPVKNVEGEETIYVGETRIDDRKESVEVEKPKQDKNKLRREGLRITRLKVDMKVLKTTHLNDTDCFSLVKLTASTTKFDSLQLFMSLKLCPILGDHVYSHRVATLTGQSMKVDVKNALTGPQSLPKRLLEDLGMKFKDRGILPLHLHRTAMEIQRYPNTNSRGFFISAPLPDYFQYTIEKLNLGKSRTNYEMKDE